MFDFLEMGLSGGMQALRIKPLVCLGFPNQREKTEDCMGHMKIKYLYNEKEIK